MSPPSGGGFECFDPWGFNVKSADVSLFPQSVENTSLQDWAYVSFYVELNQQEKKSQCYLEVFERDPPLIGRIFGWVRDEQRPTEAGDRLAAVRVFGGGVNIPAAVEGGFGAVVLQLHGVQREPAACRHLVVTLTHHEAGHTNTPTHRPIYEGCRRRWWYSVLCITELQWWRLKPTVCVCVSHISLKLLWPRTSS